MAPRGNKTAGWVLACLCAGVLATPTLGQAPAAPANQETTTLRVTTRLVQVNVIVQDKQGNPVSDLTRSDFKLFDQGKEQPISVFAVDSNQALSPPAQTVQPLPPDTFSNRLEYRGAVPQSVTVILLDGLHTTFWDRAYAKDQIVKFLSQLQPQDRVALYALGRKLQVLHDFTSDATPLIRALTKNKEQIPSELAAPERLGTNPDSNPALATVGLGFDIWLRDTSQIISHFSSVDNLRAFCAALESIAHHVSRFPGRKNLVWVSGGFGMGIGLWFNPMEAGVNPTTFAGDVERAKRALNEANLALYPVDARGLIGEPGFAASNREISNLQIGRGSEFQARQQSFADLKILAEGTGGRAFYNTNDIKGSVRVAIDDSRVTYLLGYYPSHGQWHGKFREIKIKVDRPDLQLRYRRGYLALAPGSSSEADRKASLGAAVWSPLDPTSVGVTVQATAIRGSPPGAPAMALTIQVDPRDITLQHQNDHWVGDVKLLFVQLDAQGNSLHSDSATLDMNMTRPTYEGILRDGLSISRDLQIVPGTFRVRVLVRDEPTDALGGVSIPVGKVLSGADK